MMFILNWWNAMSPAMHGFMFAAIPATIVLVLQTALLLIGLGDGGSDADTDIDTDTDFDTDFDTDADIGFAPEDDFSNADSADALAGDLRIFTVRGFVAFFAVFGWAGAAILEANLPLWFALIGAFAAGSVAMIAIAWIMKAVLKLQSSGNINPKNSVGKSGAVYMTIPKNRTGTGKINIVLQDRYSEMEAVTDSENDILPGREVTVTGVTTLGTLIVREK